MNDERRRVTLTKAQCETPAGREFIALLIELSADGIVTRPEMDRLRSWLEVDRGVDFPALAFLYQVIEEISADGELAEEELDRLALAIERVLPKDVRAEAASRRRQAREARRVVEREKRRRSVIAERAEARADRASQQARAGILYRREFAVRGAFRFEARREACARIIDGDSVSLERERDNAHDANAILVLGADDCELGYVPREEAAVMAPLLDSGAEAEATICRLWETPENHDIVPILAVTIRRGESNAAPVQPLPRQRRGRPITATSKAGNRAGCAGCGCTSAAVCLVLLLALCLAAFALR
jgi:hypothetical protein